MKDDDPAVVTYVVPAFRDDEDTELEYKAKLVVGDGEQDPPCLDRFRRGDADFYVHSA